jgi:hypothetical protein
MTIREMGDGSMAGTSRDVLPVAQGKVPWHEALAHRSAGCCALSSLAGELDRAVVEHIGPKPRIPHAPISLR